MTDVTGCSPVLLTFTFLSSFIYMNKYNCMNAIKCHLWDGNTVYITTYIITLGPILLWVLCENWMTPLSLSLSLTCRLVRFKHQHHLVIAQWKRSWLAWIIIFFNPSCWKTAFLILHTDARGPENAAVLDRLGVSVFAQEVELLDDTFARV